MIQADTLARALEELYGCALVDYDVANDVFGKTGNATVVAAIEGTGVALHYIQRNLKPAVVTVAVEDDGVTRSCGTRESVSCDSLDEMIKSLGIPQASIVFYAIETRR